MGPSSRIRRCVVAGGDDGLVSAAAFRGFVLWVGVRDDGGFVSDGVLFRCGFRLCGVRACGVVGCGWCRVLCCPVFFRCLPVFSTRRWLRVFAMVLVVCGVVGVAWWRGFV